MASASTRAQLATPASRLGAAHRAAPDGLELVPLREACGRRSATRSARCGASRWRWPGSAIIVGWLVLGLPGAVLPIQDPDVQNLPAKLQPPSRAYPFGTDDLGRDMISRVIYGARVSVPAGILVIALTGVVGCLLGAIAGYVGGPVDSVIMRAADAILSFPSIILAMAITAARGGPGLSNALIAVGIVLWPEYARLMRGQVLAVRANEFVTAAESIGANRWRVLFRHILP